MTRPTADIELVLPCNVLERQAIDSVMDQLSPLFEEKIGKRSALFLASPDAGSATALRFWSDAQTAGVAFANPELFPWCLANAPCAALARRFRIVGPNCTWLGGEEALQAALAAAEYALRQHKVECVFIVNVSFGLNNSANTLRVWCLHDCS